MNKHFIFAFSIGARVVVADYDMEKGNQALQQLYNETSCHKNDVRLIKCDLRSFESVRQFIRLYDEREDKLDVLICNAGIAWAPKLITTDGMNTVIQVNYLGHFLLVNLLLNKLKRSQPSRIIFVASGSHRSKSTWSSEALK